MNKNILLIEPNYKNKFPPIALMKISTYYKNRGDRVLFYKGDIKDFIIDRIANKLINKFREIESDYQWNVKKDIICNYIRTQKNEYLKSLNLYKFESFFLLNSWAIYYKDFYCKNKYIENPEWDCICITTLFTFYFDITVKTINEAKPLLKKGGKFFIGGVLATLQPEQIEKATGIKPIAGLLNQPGILDENDTQIIDSLPLDYTILEEIDYKYQMSNAYYAYVTRGCIRHCPFCAVPKLEPQYKSYIPLKKRIDEVINICGEQRDLLLMDNNVLASPCFDKIIDDIIDCGFEKGAKFVSPNYLYISIKNLELGINDRGYIKKAYYYINKFYRSIKDKKLSYFIYNILYDNNVLKLETSTKESLISVYKQIKYYHDKYLYRTRRPQQRSVDFNQGLDARLFNDHIAQQLSKISINPVRIAFDDIQIKNTYINAIEMCAKHGMKNFSNYLLYNYKDHPCDLFERLYINVELCEKLSISIYSFPMRYHPLYGEHSHDRNYIGTYWNAKYIRAIQAILNCTKGKIGKGESFFFKAFGRTKEEFLSILEMPEEFIIYRFFFQWLDKINHKYSMNNWLNSVNSLNAQDREIFYSIIHSNNIDTAIRKSHYSTRVAYALSFYNQHLRDSIENNSGDLHNLKMEFDKISEEDLLEFKNERNGIIEYLPGIKS